MAIEAIAVPRTTGASCPTLVNSTTDAALFQSPDPARAGVLAELADWGRPGNARSVRDLIHEDERPFLEAVWRIEPGLVWIAWWSGSCSAPPPDLAHPIRELKARLARRSIGRSAWKRLVGESGLDALALFKRGGSKPLESHLRLETLLDRALPFTGAAAEWVQRFEWRWAPVGHFTLERSEVQLSPAHAAHLLELGLARLAEGSFEHFTDEELPLVLRYWSTIVPGHRVPRWENLLSRARAAHERATEVERGQSCRWESGLTATEFGGYRINALSDSYALWHEGLTMRHCIADYAERCVDDGLRVFHLQSDTSRSRWTLALAPDSEDEWRVHEMRGPRNKLADANVRAIAAAWALAYAGIFPPGKNGLTPLEDDDEDEDAGEHCPICDAQYCEEHLVATLELDEGVMNGCLYHEWDDRVGEIQAELQQALLTERPNPDWPSEVDSLYAALLEDRDNLVVEDYPGEPDAEWVIDDDAFHDAWCNLDATRLLINYLEEWLNEQPGVIANSYEISTAPGLSWAGTYFHARDPEPVRQRFLKEFCVGPALIPDPEVQS
jgi:hypothetical protein